MTIIRRNYLTSLLVVPIGVLQHPANCRWISMCCSRLPSTIVLADSEISFSK